MPGVFGWLGGAGVGVAEALCAGDVLVGRVELKWVSQGCCGDSLHLGSLDEIAFTVVGVGWGFPGGHRAGATLVDS